MLTYTQIVDKLKEILSQELNAPAKDKDVATALEVEYNNFRKQKSRNSPHYPEIMQFLAQHKISINWFFFNQLPETLIDATSDFILIKYHKDANASAGGGSFNYSLEHLDIVVDQQLLDHLSCSYLYTEIVHVYGDSMEPDIKDNSLVFIDTDIKELNPKKSFLINTQEGLFIKKIVLKEDSYYMRSNATHFIDTKLDFFDVIGEVKGVLYKL